ncbi:MAG: beta-ketoacyl synthase N-terminal-like domain-containing protein [Elainellaceae cyanobacterium]
MAESTPPNSDPTLSPTKRALLALNQLQAKLDALEAAQHEPIAIIGMSCRFPGNVETPDAFRKLLDQQADAITEVPSDRWPMGDYHSADPDAPGKMVSRYGGFVPHLYDFDAPFFRIAPREAIALDPQQRLWLELGWESLEHAGTAADSLAGQPVGVFLGISSIDYWQRLLAQHPDAINAYLATGNTHSVAAGRLSFLLGITGPSVAVDAACASSLVAVHLACQSLRQRECNMAIAGGVNRVITPEASINFSKARMLSADGRCRTFDQAASGFGRAEGGGAVVLKRLSDAMAAGDRVEAVILGSAMNHDGRTSGLTVPNGPAQQAVIRQALSNSRIEPEAVGYVETHGTGTALGDPIEVGALGAVFGERRSDRPLILGAVKTNIGHLEAAAGMAGLIKAVLALQQAQIPANLHQSVPSPNIDWSLSLKAPAAAVTWPPSEAPHTAGVSAFGFSGSNAHVVLTEANEKEVDISPGGLREGPHLLALSARTPAALNQLVARYAQHLTAHPQLNIADLCFTASTGRSHFACRLAITASTLAELRRALVDILAGRPNAACWQSDRASAQPDADLERLAQRYVQGQDIAWQEIYGPGHRKLVLPTYPFQRQHYGIT